MTRPRESKSVEAFTPTEAVQKTQSDGNTASAAGQSNYTIAPSITDASENQPAPQADLVEAAKGTCAALAAAISLLERTPKAKKAAPSDTIFDMMLEDYRRALNVAREAIAALSAVPTQEGTLQARVQPWMMACFGPEISNDRLERSDRLIEEVFELVQSGDYPEERIDALKRYVYNRPNGEMPQEVGGVQITLAAFCLAHNLDMHECGEIELARIWTKVEKIRAKHAAKPTGSALPVALPAAPKREA